MELANYIAMPSTGALALRAVTPADGAIVRAIFAASRAAEWDLLPLPEAQKRQLIEMQFLAQDGQYRSRYPDGSFELILVDGACAGRLYVNDDAEGITLIDIALLPEYRGRGVGNALLRGLQAYATEHGKAVFLQVVQGNPAQRLYQRLGFEVLAGEGVYMAMQWMPPAREARMNPQAGTVPDIERIRVCQPHI